MMIRQLTRRVPVLALYALLPATMLASGQENRVEPQKEGIRLIGQLEEAARDINYHADRLNSFTRTMQISKWTHLDHLNEIKEAVNDGLRPALDRLTEIQPHLPAWKQNSVDLMLESARTLAADTNNAILTKNESGTVPVVLNTEYKNLVSQIYDHSERLLKASDAAGEYASAQLKAQEAGLKVPTS
jgi:hypothetical protein